MGLNKKIVDGPNFTGLLAVSVSGGSFCGCPHKRSPTPGRAGRLLDHQKLLVAKRLLDHVCPWCFRFPKM